MAISDKLTYLNETKTLLKNKINLTGANITTDTFRQYPTKLQNALLNIWNNEGEPIFTNWGTKVNGEGTNVKLDNTLNARMKITPKGNTTQNGTPTPDSPIPVNVVSGDNEVVVCGKNLFNLNDLVKGRLDNGVIGYANGTDSITISGDTLTFVTNSGYRGVSTKSYISVTPNTRYFMQYSTSANVSLVVACYDSTKTFLSNASAYGTTGGRYYDIPANANYIRINIQYASTGSCTISNIQFEKGSITTYEPYTSQNYSISLGVENLITYSVRNGNALYFNGSTQNVYPFKAGTYTLSYEDTNSCFLYYKTANVSSTSLGSNKVTTFTINEDFNIWLYRNGMVDNEVSEIQLEKGSKANSYTPPNTTPIELCKIGDYQDYIYKDNGKWYLHKEVRKLQLNISDMDNSEDYPGWNNLTQLKADIPNKNNLLKEESDYYSNIALESDGSISVNTLNNNALLFLRKNIFNLTQTQWKTTYPNLVFTIYYGFQNGEEIEITDTNLISQLEDLKSAMSYEGQTNISSGFMIVGASALGELE